jgi:hypothetical protein
MEQPEQPVLQPVLMQYQTPLSDDFDTASILQRIKSVAAPYDVLPGLIFKLYGLNPGADFNQIKEYSSIYLWDSLAPMQKLLTGDLFADYSEVFHRPPVRMYIAQSVTGAIGELKTARYAVRRNIPLPRQGHPGNVIRTWVQRLRRPEALVQVIGFDPASWELADLTVWLTEPPTLDFARTYSLAYISLPKRDAS